MKVDNDSVCATEMLPVPRAADLGAEQVDGAACVWCGKAPDIGIGLRISVFTGTLRRWLPRACHACVGSQAVRVYRLHISSCARCSHRDYCPDSRALHELALEYR